MSVYHYHGVVPTAPPTERPQARLCPVCNMGGRDKLKLCQRCHEQGVNLGGVLTHLEWERLCSPLDTPVRFSRFAAARFTGPSLADRGVAAADARSRGFESLKWTLEYACARLNAQCNVYTGNFDDCVDYYVYEDFEFPVSVHEKERGWDIEVTVAAIAVFEPCDA